MQKEKVRMGYGFPLQSSRQRNLGHLKWCVDLWCPLFIQARCGAEICVVRVFVCVGAVWGRNQSRHRCRDLGPSSTLRLGGQVYLKDTPHMGDAWEFFVYMWVYLLVCVCVRVLQHASVRVQVRLCTCVCVCIGVKERNTLYCPS